MFSKLRRIKVPFIGGSISLFAVIIGIIIGALWGNEITAKIPFWDKVKKAVGK